MDSSGERAKLLAAIDALEGQRALLGDAVVDPAIAGLRDQLAALSPAAFEAEGERKLVTVMFADASGFTAMSEANDPEYVRNLINGCFEALVPVVETHDGTIDKFIGDAIMALFGAPVAREDDAERAVRASLAMMKALDTFNRANNVKVGLHFGINTGEVIAGKIGAAGRRDYSVIGDAVNVAARLQDLSKRGQIFVGPETHRLTAAAFEYEAMDAAALKGRESPVPVFRLIGPKRKPITGLFWKTSYDNPMVGREAEIERLAQAAIDLRSKREGRAFIVSGDAGVGKSRLLAEARRHAGLDFAWVQGRAQSHSQSTSYATERELLFGLIGATVDTGPAEAAGLLLGSCNKLMGDEAEEVYAHLVALAGLPVDEIAQPFIQSVSGDALKPRIAKAFLHFTMAWAGRRPLALCFEDIHWVDGATLQLIRDLARAAKTAPMLLILTARSEALADLALDDDEVFAHLRLAPLDGKASESLVRNFLNCEALPGETLRFLGRRAEGNPFFLEELLRSLVETGALEIKDGRAVATRPITDAAIPTTLQGIIMARMDRLPTQSKATLQTASVIGRTFPLRLLAFVHDGGTIPPTTLHSQLKLLEDREFVRRNEGERIDMAEREYVFQHAVTQEVVYGSMLGNRRKTIHLSIAETLENYFGDRSDEFASALALHYKQAGKPRRSAEYYLIAARQAAAVFAHEEARTSYRAALDQLAFAHMEESAPGDARLMAEAHIGLGDVLENDGDHKGAQDAYAAALELSEPHESVLRSSIHRKTGFTHISQRLSVAALECYARAAEALEADAVRNPAWWSEWIEVQLERMWAIYWMGDAVALRSTADALRPQVEAYGDLSQKSRFLKRFILIAFREERLNLSKETLARAHEAMELSLKCNDPDDLARAHFMIACCNLWQDDFDDAWREFQDCLKLVEHTGNTEYIVMTTAYLATIKRKQHDGEGLRDWAGRALSTSTEGRMPLYQGMAKGNEAALKWRAGDHAAALDIALPVVAAWKPLPFQLKWIAAWPALGALHATGRIAEAGDAIAIMLQPSQNRQPPEIMEGLGRAATALDAGDVMAADAAIAAILPLARERGYA